MDATIKAEGERAVLAAGVNGIHHELVADCLVGCVTAPAMDRMSSTTLWKFLTLPV